MQKSSNLHSDYSWKVMHIYIIVTIATNFWKNMQYDFHGFRLPTLQGRKNIATHQVMDYVLQIMVSLAISIY